MSQLVPTLRALLAEADALLEARQPTKARASFEALLEAAQERADRAMAITARSMLARLAVRRRDADEARAHLAEAAAGLDPNHLESHGRYRAALVRLAIFEGPPEASRTELRHYLDWAETHEQWEEAVDASSLLAEQSASAQEGREWLERGIDIAAYQGLPRRVAPLYTHLAALYEVDGDTAQALDAHASALDHHRKNGAARDVVAACWAVGACALLVEDWPLARQRLEEALDRGAADPDCADLIPLAQADLAAVHDQTGDPIEARRLMVRAMESAREQDLATYWPERWAAMVRQAVALDLEQV